MNPALREANEFDKRIEAFNTKLRELKPEDVSKKTQDTVNVLEHAREVICKQVEEARADLHIEFCMKQRAFDRLVNELNKERDSLVVARNALLQQATQA